MVLLGTAIGVAHAPGRADDLQSRRARLQRGAVRLLVRGEQQRQRVRRLYARTRRSTTACSGMAMLVGRFWVMLPVLAIAGSLASKKMISRGARHAADAHAAVRRDARGRRDRRRCADASSRRSPWVRSSSTCMLRRTRTSGRHFRNHDQNNCKPCSIRRIVSIDSRCDRFVSQARSARAARATR